MTREEILCKLGEIVNRAVAHDIDPAAVKDDDRLNEDLGVSSMEQAEILFEVDDLEIEDDEAGAVYAGGTIGHVIQLIEKKSKR